MAGNQWTTPEIKGVLTPVSADLTREQQQNAVQPAQAYYTVRITLPPEEAARLDNIRLVPGMPVEVLHPDPRAHAAGVPAQAASGTGRADFRER
jgi:hypothetical protein